MKTKLAFLLCLSTLTLFAQNNYSILNTPQQSIQVAYTANPQSNFQCNYFFVNPKLTIFDQSIGLGATLSVPFFALKNGFDFDFSIDAFSFISIFNKFKTVYNLSLAFHRVSDLNATFFNYGLQIDVFPGFYFNRFSMGPHFTFEYRPFVHIKHKEYAKQAFYDLYDDNIGTFRAPQDGWFMQNFNKIGYGLYFSYYSSKWNVTTSLDYCFSIAKMDNYFLGDIGMLPFKAYIGFGYNFK